MPSTISRIKFRKKPLDYIRLEIISGLKIIKIEKQLAKKMITWVNKNNGVWVSSDKKHHLLIKNKTKQFILVKKIETSLEWKEIVDRKVCTDCFQIHKLNELTTINPDHSLCKNCMKNLCKCIKCNDMIHKDNGKQLNFNLNDNFCCKTCIKKYFKRCSRCDNFYPSEEMKIHDERYFCPRCVKEVICPCQSCNISCFKDEMRRQNDRLYCETCYNNSIVIKDWNYVPNKFNFHKLNWDNKLCLGIEVEVETNQPGKYDEKLAKSTTDYLKSLNLDKLFYIKHDGTIQGFELVAHPATLQYLHNKVPWFQIMKWLREQGFTSYKSGNCGLHIHLNKEFFTPLDVHKLRLFFAINKPFIYKFSKRFGYNDRYCQFESFQPNSFITSARKQDGKYWAIRTKPQKKNSVELRVFRGTLSYPRFLATLQFSDALAHYIKMVSIVSCQNKASWINFIQWCTKNNTYNHFIQYIKNHKELEKPEV